MHTFIGFCVMFYHWNEKLRIEQKQIVNEYCYFDIGNEYHADFHTDSTEFYVLLILFLKKEDRKRIVVKVYFRIKNIQKYSEQVLTQWAQINIVYECSL